MEKKKKFMITPQTTSKSAFYHLTVKQDIKQLSSSIKTFDLFMISGESELSRHDTDASARKLRGERGEMIHERERDVEFGGEREKAKR